MKITFDRAVLIDAHNGVVLDIPDIQNVTLAMEMPPKVRNIDTDEVRELSDLELRTLEDCLDEFAMRTLGQALAKVARRSY